MTGETAAGVPDQALRSALEFAVNIAAAGSKLRPQLAFPTGLKPFLRFHKLPPTALSQVRLAIEADDEFRGRLASVATAELVDQVGVLWLSRPEGWSDAIAGILPTKAPDDAAAARRDDRRREAAQAAATRARAELLGLTASLERERAANATLVAESERLRGERDDLRNRLREAQRAEHATAQALARIEAELLDVRGAEPEPEPERGPPSVPATIDAVAARSLIEGAVAASGDVVRLLTEALAEIAPVDVPHAPSPPPRQGRAARRSSIRLPGGVLADSAEAAEFLLRTKGATTLIDGYNVAKLGWPLLDLEQQRQQCMTSVENLAKRWNISMTVVFDGAEIRGAHASKHQRVRVVYSPAGVSADDVLRAEVAAMGRDQAVVVVTNDRAIISDVEAAGVNTVSSDVFLALVRR